MSKTLIVPPKRDITKALSAVDGSLFERNPIKLDGFRLRARAAVPVGTPSIRQWQVAFEFASAAEEASPYWIGDLLRYAESREDWKQKIDQAAAVTGLSRQRLHNLTTISRQVAEPERCLAPSPAHAAEVAALPRPEQTRFLEHARSHGQTVRELRQTIRASQRSKVLDGRADNCFTIDVTVTIDVQAQNSVRAEESAWDDVKRAVQSIPGAKVIASRARKEAVSA